MWPLNTNADSAKTQVYLAASDDVRDTDVKGQYWVPVWSWTNRYIRCRREDLTAVAKDEEGQKKLWETSEEAVGKVKV